jgi:DNA repair exonuclease SbcCD ATPase subunit
MTAATDRAGRPPAWERSTPRILDIRLVSHSEASDVEPRGDPNPLFGNELDKPLKMNDAAWSRDRSVRLPYPSLTALHQQPTELEDDLGEELAHQENAISSLQASLELIASENTRLATRLSESDALVAKLGSQLEKMNTALIEPRPDGVPVVGQVSQTTAESVVDVDQTQPRLDQFAVATIAADRERADIAERNPPSRQGEIESNPLVKQFSALLSRAVAAERQLTQAQQNLMASQAERDLARQETSLLRKRLAENSVAIDRARTQIERAKVAKIATEDEANFLKSELVEANGRYSAEVSALRARLETTSLSASKAEASLKDARQGLRKKIELLQNALVEKLREGQKLEQSRAILVKAVKTLQQTLDLRNKALADADVAIKLLTERAGNRNIDSADQIRPLPVAALLASTITF